MSIKIPYTAAEFIKNEIKTLEYISNRGFFNNGFSDLANAISITYDIYRRVDLRKNLNFKFVSDFEIEIEGQPHTVVIHAQVIGNYKITTYSLGICARDGSCELIRRFHFDYVHDNRGMRQKVPISHLQYG
ncbi:unnamed protein product, partial [marine sediment metagenome]